MESPKASGKRSNIDWENITNSQIEHLITEYVHSERDRRVLRLRLIDGLTYERIADEMLMSVRQIKNIIYKAEAKLFRHL